MSKTEEKYSNSFKNSNFQLPNSFHFYICTTLKNQGVKLSSFAVLPRIPEEIIEFQCSLEK